MTARLRNHHMVLIGLGSAIAALAACSAPDAAGEADAKKTTQASSVIIEMVDINGSSLGSCSGTLIAPKMVLTAGHCIVGVHQWKVVSTAGNATGKVASTPWKNFRSDFSHPEHSDVGLIMLDSEIKLSSYPQLATKVAKDNTKGVLFHRESSTSKEHTATNTYINGGAEKGFKLNYLVKLESKFEYVDTGGALLDSKGAIVGVVSGKGKASGLLHVARVDNYNKWAKTAVACSTGLSARTWGGGGDGNGGGGGGYGGTPEDQGGGGGGWGGGGWGGGGGGWGASSGGYGGGGGKGNGGGGAMDGGTTVPGSTSSGGQGGSSSGASSSSGTTGEGSTSSSSGSPESGSSSGASSSSGSTGGDGSVPNTCPGIPACEGDCGEGGNGNNGGTGSESSSGGPDGSSNVDGNTGGGYDADGTPTAGGGFNKDGSTVPAGGSGADSSGGGYDSSGKPTAGGGFNKDGSVVPAGGTPSNGGAGAGTVAPGSAGYDSSGKATEGGGFNKDGSQVPAGGGGGAGGYDADKNPKAGGGYNADGSIVPAGGGSTSGPGGTAEGCEGSSDNDEVCPAAPDSASCGSSTCGGCAAGQSCADTTIDYGECAACKSGGGADDDLK